MPEGMKLSGTQLKIFAALIMVVDHIGAVFFPQYRFLRMIGRISFPIFCFLAAEGFYYTRSMEKYMLRLLIAGIVTEPVYNLAFSGTFSYPVQNVMFTFLFAAAAVYIHKCLPEQMKAAGVAAAVIMALLAEYMNTDYGAYGVLLIYIFYIFREKRTAAFTFSALFQLLAATGIQRLSVFSLIPLLFYSGKQGARLKYFFYIFYPAHLGILYLIAGMGMN